MPSMPPASRPERSLEKEVALAGNRVNAFLTIHPYKLFAMGSDSIIRLWARSTKQLDPDPIG
jgi:hypothetical protein